MTVVTDSAKAPKAKAKPMDHPTNSQLAADINRVGLAVSRVESAVAALEVTVYFFFFSLFLYLSLKR